MLCCLSRCLFSVLSLCVVMFGLVVLSILCSMYEMILLMCLSVIMLFLVLMVMGIFIVGMEGYFSVVVVVLCWCLD